MLKFLNLVSYCFKDYTDYHIVVLNHRHEYDNIIFIHGMKIMENWDFGVKDLSGLGAFSFENGRGLQNFENDKNLTMCKEFDLKFR